MGIYFDGGLPLAYTQPEYRLTETATFFCLVTPPLTLHPVFIPRLYTVVRKRAGDRYNLFLIGNLFFEFRCRVSFRWYVRILHM